MDRGDGASLRRALEQVDRATLYPVPGPRWCLWHPSQQRFSASLLAVPLPFCTGSATSAGLTEALDRPGVVEIGRGCADGAAEALARAQRRAPHQPSAAAPPPPPPRNEAKRLAVSAPSGRPQVRGPRVTSAFTNPSRAAPKLSENQAVLEKIYAYYESLPTGPRMMRMTCRKSLHLPPWGCLGARNAAVLRNR